MAPAVSPQVTGTANILSEWKSTRGGPGRGRAGLILARGPSPFPRAPPPGIRQARGPMCLAAARAVEGILELGLKDP